MMDTQQMLDNAAGASQLHELLDPVARGAILRSMVQWLEQLPLYDSFYHDGIVELLQADPEFKK